MTREEVRDELAQAARALATVADEFTQAPDAAEGEAASPLNALYFAVHHLHRAVEKLAAEQAGEAAP
jgi:hypothetical protein